MINKSLAKWSLEDPLFKEHMSFVVGPRQCGKTTMAKTFLKSFDPDKFLQRYFLWDSLTIRKRLRENPYFFESLQVPEKRVSLVFDEIHKMTKWKNYLKGAYDSFRDQFQFIVTGSGRLDHYQHGGDSLAGRYDLYFAYPFTPGEIEGRLPAEGLTIERILEEPAIGDDLMKTWESCSGFPEPFLSGSQNKATRWWDQYQIRVIEEDVRDLSRIESLDRMKDLLQLMPGKIASPLSINNIAEDLRCAHATAERYIKLMQKVFFTFEVPPFSQKISRAIKKEKKNYFYFHSASDDVGDRFENMVALLLLKWCSAATEQAFGSFKLHYIRDQDRREVDFLITKSNRPYLLIEAKHSDLQLTNAIQAYSRLLKVPALQVVRQPNVAIKKDLGAVVSIHKLVGTIG